VTNVRTEPENPYRLIVSDRTRWFAVITGFVAAVAGAFAGGLFLAIPIPLVLGAVIQPRFPRGGRALICAGAVWLTFWVFDIGFFAMLETHSTNRHGLFDLLVLVVVLLVAFCDFAIVTEEVTMRRG
jgi:hypothetical protein